MPRHSVARDARRDALLSLRVLLRRPAFTLVAIATLALGIGAPTTFFSVVNGVLLRPLPYPEPDRIVRFRMEVQSPQGPFAFDALPVSPALAWSRDSRTLTAMAIFDDRALTLARGDGPYRLSGVSATPNLFEVLGTTPALGTTFSSTETDPHEIVLSDDTWRRFFSADPAIVGTSARLDDEFYRITGVMPQGFGFPTPETAFWIPQPLSEGGTRGMLLPAIARLTPGATVGAVEQEGLSILNQDSDPRMHQVLRAETLLDQMVGPVRRVLWILMAAVSLVFIVATANIALLLLTRGAGREREFSIRLALGAGRGRLVRQLFVEGIVLALLGGTAALASALAGVRLLIQMTPANLPRLQNASIDGRVLLFAVGITVATSLLFGVLSAGRTVAIDALRGLTGSARESRLIELSPLRRRLNVLAAGALAATTVLLVGAGLLLRSFVSLVLVPQGFDSHGALAFSVDLPAARYPTVAARSAFHGRLLDRLEHAPGVSAAGLAVSMPNKQPTARFELSASGIDFGADPRTRPTADVRMISEGFVEAMGLHLIAGRTFTRADGPESEPVVLISETMARKEFHDRPPIGQTLYSGQGNRRVLGVVSDVKPASDTGAPPNAAAYVPMRQVSDQLSWWTSVNVVVRGPNAGAQAPAMRQIVLALDPNMPPFNVRTLDDEVASLVAGPRFAATALAYFAMVALVMASIGVYGVMSYAVGQRTREIGVRVALGATRAQIMRLMMRDGVIVVLGGLGVGLAAALVLTHTLTSLLYDVQRADPLSLAGVAALLSVAGLAAAYVPARRAMRLNVITALRED